LYNLNFENLILYNAGEAGITVEVEIRFGDLKTGFEAKIDTGATACIFERKLGEEIGLEIEKGDEMRFSSATDSSLTYGHFVTLTVREFEFYSYVFFAANESFKRNVLGRTGWLDRLRIGLIDYDGKLYLSRYESE
jgi:Aspartyl protease